MAVSHYGVSTADLDRSIAFYTTFFGFSLVKTFEKAEFEIKGALLEREDVALEILQPYKPVPKRAVVGPLAHHLRSLGANHIALGAADLPELRKHMASDGVTLITEIMGERTFFCSDPDGTPIEVRKA